eukprot:TRINITY_DN1547_c1_g1_i3.p1 TRINITY_DN1547_c1_g1~~TRINITY_DN1547_c1_g1_i3.p1  ORF type:complete len:379 (+),score=154.52 TRINITY_DN1547_c1_g1_i3:64-1200(+)
MASWGSLKSLVKKKPAADASDGAGKVGLEKKDGMTWVRRKDVVEKHNKDYAEEMARLETERQQRREAEGRVRKEVARPTRAAKASKEAEAVASMPKQEVVKMLRERGEPVTLFGETDEGRCERLQQMMTKEVTLDDLNPMLGGSLKERMEKATEAALAADKARLEQGQTAEEAEAQEQKTLLQTIGEKVSGLAEQTETLERLEAADPIDPTQPRPLPAREVHPYLAAFVRRALIEWELQLLKRPADVVKSFQGRKEHTRFQETSSFLEPLLQQLASKDGVASRITAPLRKVVWFTQRKQYIKAMDEYIALSVGRAQWPLGVTQVGIHDRVGRDRISADKQAHLLSNEATRKYIQAFKRLVTQMQVMYPAESESQAYRF